MLPPSRAIVNGASGNILENRLVKRAEHAAIGNRELSRISLERNAASFIRQGKFFGVYLILKVVNAKKCSRRFR